MTSQMPGADTSRKTAKKADFADWMIVIAFAFGMSFTALLLGAMPLVRTLSGSRDYLVYWATGQQLVHHANPYDADQMGRIEHNAGLAKPGSYYMRNPPWALPLAYPLGFIPERAGALPWSLLMLGIMVVSIRLISRTIRPLPTQIALLAFCFPPALICIVMGQLSLLVLLGLVLFVRLHDRRPYLAGASLFLCTLKPHLLLVVGIVLVIWMIRNRSYRIMAGFAAALAVGCLLTEWIDPEAWSQYFHWSRHSGIETEFVPCVGVVLRQALSPTNGWLAFVPAVFGCLWGVRFYWFRRQCWNWFEDGGMLVLISIFVAPYCWIWDQCLALFALVPGARRTTSRGVLGALAGLYILIEIMQFKGVSIRSALYLWPAVAWPIWNLIARHQVAAAGESAS